MRIICKLINFGHGGNRIHFKFKIYIFLICYMNKQRVRFLALQMVVTKVWVINTSSVCGAHKSSKTKVTHMFFDLGIKYNANSAVF